MDDDLPTDFDIIVVGTGLPESIVAAAASRIGKKVLHVDENDYYGDLWASFSLEGLRKLLQSKQLRETSSEDIPGLIPTSQNDFIQDISEEWFIPSEPNILSDALQKCKLTQTENPPPPSEEIGEGDTSKEIDSTDVVKTGDSPRRVNNKEWTQGTILRDSRKFNIDVAPKLLYSRGPLVELLISSNIARYAEFRNVSRVLTWMFDQLQDVPCSRSDVFATKQVSVVEKRMLMKLLNDVMNPDKDWDAEGFKDMTFHDALATFKLSENVVYYVLYTMAAGTKETMFDDGLKRMKRFLNSLGVYGNTPFLWAMYGSGEIPQCFCRLCAVFGGTYCLNRPIKGLFLDDGNKIQGIRVGNQNINAPVVVMGVSKLPKQYLPNSEHIKVSRAIFIINKSIKPSEKENLTYLRFPPIDDGNPCNVFEVGPSTSACPNNLYLLYMSTIQRSGPKEDLAPFVSKLLNTNILEACSSQSTQTNTLEQSTQACASPQALYAFYYTTPDLSQVNLQENVPTNLWLCSGPDNEVDYAFAVEQGKKIFKEIYPEEDFLPRAPDPEEIVLEGGEAESDKAEEVIAEPDKVSPAEEVKEH